MFNKSSAKWLVSTLYLVGCVSTTIGHQRCNYTEEIMEAIASKPENRLYLSKLFYPINRASPSYAIIGYFVGYNGQLPYQCKEGVLPWKEYPQLNITEGATGNIWWMLWSTNALHSITSPMLMETLGLSTISISYRVFFNKTSPFVFPTPMACLAIPCDIDSDKDKDVIHMLGETTVEILKIISPKRYIQQLLDIHYPGQYYGYIARGMPQTDIREGMHLSQDNMVHTCNIGRLFGNNLSFFCLLALIAYGLPLLLYKREGIWLKRVEIKIKCRKGLVVFFWSLSVMGYIFSYCGLVTSSAISCFDPEATSDWKRVNCVGSGIASVYIVVTSAIVSLIHSNAITLPIPRMIQIGIGILSKCCKGVTFPEELTTKIMVVIGLNGINNMLIGYLSIGLPSQILMLSSNFYLNGTAILSCFMIIGAMVIFIAVIFTVDQAFSPSQMYRLTREQVLVQSLALSVTFFLLVCCLLFLLSIHFLLRLTKDGEKTQSISTALLHVLSALSYITMPKLIPRIVALLERGIKAYFKRTLHQNIDTQHEH